MEEKLQKAGFSQTQSTEKIESIVEMATALSREYVISINFRYGFYIVSLYFANYAQSSLWWGSLNLEAEMPTISSTVL